MQFKIGDRVRIKEDLKEGWYDGTYFNEYLMGKHKGKETIVTNITYNKGKRFIKLEIDNERFAWGEDMLIKILKENK